MSEHNIVIKQEVEDPSYGVTNVNNVAPNTVTSYEVSTEFVSVKIEKDDPDSAPIRHIKEEPLDLALERRPDSPQVPDSTTDRPVKAEHRSVEVEVTLELVPEEKSEQEQAKNEQQDTETKSIQQLMEEKMKKNELKKKFVIENGRFSCLVCHKPYMTKASIVRHLLKHTEKDFENPPKNPLELHKCDKCGKTFKCASNLLQHSYIHLDKKQFQCERCQRSFTLKSNLIRHQGKSQCQLPDTKIICEVCNKFFATDSMLRSHLKKHSAERPFACDDCGMNFKYKSTLVRHLQHHKGDKPYACNICNKTFTHFGLIKPHMRMHTGEKPYSCPICSKKFSHKHNMLRHTVRHDKVVNLNCPVCDKKFPKESRLKYHMRTHMDEKCFACAICPKKFSHRQNVIRHYSRKHPDKIYESTDTDASVALKLWNEVKNNERPLPAIDANKRRVVKKKENNNQSDNVDNEGIKPDVEFIHEYNNDNYTNQADIKMEIEEEEILPDIKEKPQTSFEVVNIKIECEFDGEEAV
ncbi:hypothetical protein ABMA27_011176 [Loxostege sticticalis]|uniref:C2H2-type domain-containing protein n=1 Tax=Loxostege sticticalis TaxID=481309 RepID=A0ABR3H2C0_LOXSC